MKSRDKRRRLKARRLKVNRADEPKAAKDCGGYVCGECEACRAKMNRIRRKP